MPKARKEHLSKRSNKKGSSSTPGKQKGQNCQRSISKNFVTKDTKGWKKDPNLWLQGCKEISSMKGNFPVSEMRE